MKFGYFTLSDNRYPNNTRTAEQFVREIYQQALHAEKIGLNSAWIGEHHFNLLGVNPCPNILLAKLAGATTRIRLAPAVVLLPVHHPLHVAEEWATLDLLSDGRVDFAAGRGYDRLEYAPFGADFQIIRPNELIDLEAKYAFETDDGAVVYVENRGIRFGPVELLQKLKRGEPVDPKLIYFRTVPKFETGAGKYRWLMQHIFVASAARHADRVVIDVFQVM